MRKFSSVGFGDDQHDLMLEWLTSEAERLKDFNVVGIYRDKDEVITIIYEYLEIT